MGIASLSQVLRRSLLRLQDGNVLTDGHLLERFVAQGDQVAFEELVRRHGPMVFRVCQRLLGKVQDAEDAFQATFIVLARRADRIVKQASVGSWLYGVAYRVALQARRRLGQDRLRCGDEVLDSLPGAAGEQVGSELRAVLDEELQALPDKLRAPMVLCYLEGKTNAEAAQLLHYSTKAIEKQLHQARAVLRDRLARRGLALGGGLLAASLTQAAAPAAVPEKLALATTKGALLLAQPQVSQASFLTAHAHALAETILPETASRKLRWAICLLLALGGAGMAVALALALPWHRPAATSKLPSAAAAQRVELGAVAPFRQVVFSADRRFAALADTAGHARLCKLEDFEGPRLTLPDMPQLEPNAPGAKCCSLAFSPDGKQLAVGDQDGRVQFFDPVTRGKLFALRAAHAGQVMRLAFAPDGQALAAVVAQGGLTTWNLRTQKVQSRVDLPKYLAADLVYTAQGELLAINSPDYVAHCWDAVTGQTKRVELPSLPPTVPPGKKLATVGLPVALAGDGSMVFVCDDHGVYYWQRGAAKLQFLFALEESDASSFLVSPRADTVACHLRKTNRVMVWEVKTGQLLHEVERPFEGGILCLAYYADGRKFFWTGYRHEWQPDMISIPIAGEFIDLEVRRRELAAARGQ